MVNSEIIKIEQENKTEAEFMSRSFVDKSIKNRAYINAGFISEGYLINFTCSKRKKIVL